MNSYEEKRKQIRISVGNNIKNLRESLSMSKTELANKLSFLAEKKISVSSVIGWEQGDYSPDLSLLPFLCQILQCEMNDLLNIDNQKNIDNKREYIDFIDKKTFSNNLQALRLKNNLTLLQVAQYVGVTKGAVHLWENGSTFPAVEYFYKLCNLFNVKPNTLLSDDLEKDEIFRKMLARPKNKQDQPKFTKEQIKALEELLKTLKETDDDEL